MIFLQKLEEIFLIAPKILYFVINLQYYTLHSFRIFFATEKFKIGVSEFGKYIGITMFISFFTNIMIGNYSDKKKNYKYMLFFLTMITTIIFSLFYLDKIMKSSIMIFWILMLFYTIFNNPKQPLLDKIVLDYLFQMPCGTGVYGKQRLWGTISYFIGSYIIEWCLTKNTNNKFSQNKDAPKSYNWENLLYYAFISTAISVISIILLIPNKNDENLTEKEEKNTTNTDLTDKEEKNTTNASIQNNSSSNYMLLLKNHEYLVFILIMFSNAITRSSMSNYLSVYHKDILKLKAFNVSDSCPAIFRYFIGLVNGKPMSVLLLFGTAFEIIIMFFSQIILEKMGLFWPLLLAQIFSLIRFAAYYLLPINYSHKYLLSCLFELIKGLYFGLAHMSAVQIASKLAPSNLRTTSQMIYQGTFNALGSLVSGYFFGYIFDQSIKGGNLEAKKFAFQRLFLINFFISFITCGLYFLKYGVIDKVLFSRNAENEKLEYADKYGIETE